MTASHPEVLRAYLTRIGAEILNWRKFIVRKYHGHYYEERAIIRINADGTLYCSDETYAPTKKEEDAILLALQNVEFPHSVNAVSLDGLPVSEDAVKYVFYARTNENARIQMVQEMRRNRDGSKSYIPWVMMSDGRWANMEPDEALPFWKPKEGKKKGFRVMIHEGAKSAAHAQRIVDEKIDHPWTEELSSYEHWGMIGGALAPHRTRYDELKAVAPSEVVYVCDRDYWGESALQKVAECWHGHLKGIKFGARFPESWDIADPIPEKLFSSTGYYKGPKLRELMEPATWATNIIVVPPLPGQRGKAKEMKVLRPEFAQEWMHSVKPKTFIHRDQPDKLYSKDEFDNYVRPYSHVRETSELIVNDGATKSAVIKYDPSIAPGIFGANGERFINTHIPSGIVARRGDCSIWEEFINELVPGEDDRRELIRWIATLVCRPSVKMHYGVLLISETQGIGKGTLGEKILAPLIGVGNVSYPSENEITDSNYNYWLAHRRLAVVHEIYAGHSSAAYNRLKSIVTDKNVTVSRKYMANYEIENWIHIFACSNSPRAIKLSFGDRRWFVPEMTDKKKTNDFWRRLNFWLTDDGGLEKVRWWLENWLEGEGHAPVAFGADAPDSELKKRIIEEGYSAGQLLVARRLEAAERGIMEGTLKEDEVFFLDSGFVRAIRDEIYDGRFNDRLERPATVRTVAKAKGWKIGKTRAFVEAWGKENAGARVIAWSEKLAEMTPGALAAKGLRPREEM